MQSVGWQWPGGKRVAVIFNVCLEAWSYGKAPGISPMGNPLPPGVLDTMAISWAAYGVKRGIYRLMDVLATHNAKASVMTSAIIAERAPQTVRAVADAGHEVLSHSYTMDVIPALLSVEEQKNTFARCTSLLRDAVGAAGARLAQPARHVGARSAAPARASRLQVVRRRLRRRSALCAAIRKICDRCHPARDRRQ
jgi:hypothetical protein